MRVNQAGEICAQALYRGQSLSADLSNIRKQMEEAADEELDHLAWCNKRLEELGDNPSILNPWFYAMSFSIGILTGFAGDRRSLGFVEETERQVVRHLDKHLDDISDKDIPGFGELFRELSYKTVGTSAMQSRACAVLAKGKYIFALPGSSGGVTDAWDGILKYQLDINHKPCNFVELFPRLKEK